MSLFQMSVCGGILILFVAVVRAPAINRLPKTTFLILWIIIALRLLLPFSVPMPFGVGIGFDAVLNVYQAAPAEAIAPKLSGEDFLQNAEAAADPTAKAKYGSILFILWVIGICLMSLYFFVSYVLSIKKFKMSVPDNTPYIREWLSSHKILRSIEVRSSDLITSPLTYGILRPIILLPKNLDRNDRTALEYILTHEYIHIRRFDALTKILFASVLCIHWLNPSVWVMYTLANRDMELSCDVSVIRRIGEKNRSSYALMLIDMAEQGSGMLTLYNHFGKNSITERIESIMKFKKTTALSLSLAALLVFGMTTVFAASEQQEEKEQFIVYDKDCEYNADSENADSTIDSSLVNYATPIDPDDSDFFILSKNSADQPKVEFYPKNYSDEEWNQIIADIESGKIPGYQLADFLEGKVPGFEISDSEEVTISFIDANGCLAEEGTSE